MRALRTPDDRFADLPGFPWAPRYADVGGLRMAYVEDGPAGGEPVLLLHGEPSWSFLYRKVMRVLVDAGLRVIAADMIGFGRSDKPAEMSDHSYARHVEWMRALAFDALGLPGVTLVGQDWGGLIGLRLVAEHPDRFARVVAANTGLPTGDQAMPEVWLRFRDVVAAAPEAGHLPAGAGRVPDRAARRGARRLRGPVPRRELQGRPARDAHAGPDDPRRPGVGGEPRGLAEARRLGQAVPRRVQRLATRSPGRWRPILKRTVPGAAGLITRSSRARATSCRRTPASGSAP